MFKILINIFLLSLFSLTISGKSKSNNIEKLFNSKTYIVYSQSLFSSYNFNIKEVIENSWEITDYEFIHYQEFENKITDTNKSFLLLTNVQFTNDKTNTKYNFLNLVLGHKSGKIQNMPDLVNIPLSLADQDEELWVYKLNSLVVFIQNHMRFLKDNPDKESLDLISIYQNNINDINKNVICFLKNDLEDEVSSINEINKLYTGQVKIVNKEELEKKINDRSIDIVFLHKVGDDKPSGNKICFKILLGAGDSRIYYYNYHTISKKKPNRFLAEDFKKLERKVF